MPPDVIEKPGKSTIEHGKYDDRIHVMKVACHFAGRRINNTNIGGRFEDMNVWCKPWACRPLKENRGPTL